jgi:predicted regulator of Ras-like GTPase activity (Roadblock/LC7/MglB family)
METILQRLTELEGVSGAILVGKDGLVVAGTLDGDDAEVLGAMAAACFSALSHYTEEIGTGEARQAVIEARRGTLSMIEIGDLILVVNTTPQVHLGRVRLEMTRASQRVAERVGI